VPNDGRRLGEDSAASYEAGLPLHNWTPEVPILVGELKPCKAFNNDTNSTPSVMQFGIVLATAFYALLI